MASNQVPTFDELMLPTIDALKTLGGSGTIDEIIEKIIEKRRFSDSIQAILHNEGPSTELEYRAAWARSYLKDAGIINNATRGVWALTEKGRTAESFSVPEIVAEARKRGQERKKRKANEEQDGARLDEEDWKSTLLSVLMKKVSPDGFERLTQRLLREAGFKEVRVTGRSGDGGIDGVGILRNGLISEAVLFQCKRQQASIGPGIVRDFRGAMQGRSSKGIIVTTGTFTSSAKEEATRDGAPPVELIDGERLCDLLKEYRLGVEVELIEEISVSPNWFTGI